MALYEHPDLLALWDEPDRDQLAQRVQLGDLDEARTLLAAALARYESAIEVWQREQPTWSHALLVRKGRIVRELSLTMRVVAGRKVELERGEERVSFRSEQGESQAMPNESLGRWIVTPEGAVGLLETGNEWQRWRFDGEFPVREGEVDPTLDHPTLSIEGSLMGFDWSELQWSTVLGRQGTLGLDPSFMPGPGVVPAWLDDEIAILAGLRVDDADWLALLELGHPDGPRLVTLKLADLRPASPGTHPSVVSLHPTRAGLYVLIRDQQYPFETADHLVRVEFDAAGLRAAMIPVPGEPATLDDAAVSSAGRSLAQLGERTKAVDLKALPSLVPESLVLAPDGTWLAGRSTGRFDEIWAAAIVGDMLAKSVVLGESLDPPRISADSRSLMLTVERELPELGTVRQPSLVARPSP